MHTTRHSRDARDEGAAARLYRDIQAAVATTPVARARTSIRMFAALTISGAATMLIVILASQLVYGRWAAGVSVAVYSSPNIVAIGLFTFALASVATLFAVRRGRTGFGASVIALISVAVLVAPLYATFTVLAPQHVVLDTVVVSPWGARCISIAALVGMIVMGALGWALRRAVPAAPRSRAAALGACAGAWAGFALFLFCPSGDQQHMLLGHVLPIAALTAISALLLPRVLRP